MQEKSEGLQYCTVAIVIVVVIVFIHSYVTYVTQTGRGMERLQIWERGGECVGEDEMKEKVERVCSAVRLERE